MDFIFATIKKNEIYGHSTEIEPGLMGKWSDQSTRLGFQDFIIENNSAVI